ncbi:MAG: AAA family ATPase [Trueperaceae bacterium]
MKPLKLELTGFTCFREKTTINFEDLNLFVISGPTGSGKSTLLDAMTYALYGQTPRLGSRDLTTLLSPGLMQMSLQFEFSNVTGMYRATRLLDKKPSGKIDSNVRVEQLSPGATWRIMPETEKIKEANAKLEQLVGLDYEGFTRAILLPQGAFDEFLRGDASKRRDLLVNLLNLDKVQQMQQEAGQRAKTAETFVKSVKDRLEQEYAGATPERRRELSDVLETLVSERGDLMKRQEKMTKDVKELETLKALFDEQVNVQNVLQGLKQREPQMLKERERLERARKVELLLPQVKQLEGLLQKLNALKSGFETKRSSKEKLSESFAKQKAEFEALQARGAKRLPEIDEGLVGLAKYAPLLEQLRLRGGSLSLALQPSDDVYSEEVWESVGFQLAQLPLLKQTEKAALDSERDVVEALQHIQSLQGLVKGQEKQMGELVEKGKEAREAFNSAEFAYQQAEVRDRAALLREHLHEGEACPVCEQLVQTLPPKIDSNIHVLKQQRDDLDTQVKQMRESYQEVKVSLGANKERLTEGEKTLERLTKKRDEAKAALESLIATFNEFGKDLKRIDGALQHKKHSLLIALAKQISEQTGGVDVAETQKRLQQEKRDLTEKLKSAEVALRNLERELDKLEAEVTSLEQQLTDIQSEAETHQSTVQDVLGKANFASVHEVKQAVLSSLQMKTLEAELSSFQSQKEVAERRDVELQAKLSGKSFDEAHYGTLHDEAKQLTLRLGEVQKNFGAAERDLKFIDDMLEKAKMLRRELEGHHQTYETYRQLSLDLRGNEFQDFLLNQMQSKLAARASHIIREVTEKRYDLRLLESEYHVYDAWAGETRSAKTLSGGETFIASLALALALSEILVGNKTLGALFLDEGFGTLDADTLESVAEVLEHLSSEGRMVGLITHVQSLADRLPARLIVTKSSEGSSVTWDM